MMILKNFKQLKNIQLNKMKYKIKNHKKKKYKSDLLIKDKQN